MIITSIFSTTKNNETFTVESEGSGYHDYFWKVDFPAWEPETFHVMDKFLHPDKQFLDIGSWIGPTCIYASKKCSKVVAVEADPVSVPMLRKNASLNNGGENIHIEDKAIYYKECELYFGPNTHINKGYNDSTSQLKETPTLPNDIVLQTITLQQIIEKYHLDNLALVKVDIEGGEEFILEDLEKFCSSNKIPAYISFHVPWWKDTNFSRFPLLAERAELINKDPFCSILFEW